MKIRQKVELGGGVCTTPLPRTKETGSLYGGVANRLWFGEHFFCRPSPDGPDAKMATFESPEGPHFFSYDSIALELPFAPGMVAGRSELRPYQ